MHLIGMSHNMTCLTPSHMSPHMCHTITHTCLTPSPTHVSHHHPHMCHTITHTCLTPSRVSHHHMSHTMIRKRCSSKCRFRINPPNPPPPPTTNKQTKPHAHNSNSSHAATHHPKRTHLCKLPEPFSQKISLFPAQFNPPFCTPNKSP